MTHVTESDPTIGAGTSGNDLIVVKVETKNDAFSFECRNGETILSAGLAAGYALPYECSTGTCGTCHARVMEGLVDVGWIDAPGSAKLKRDKGDILMCQARPRKDCLLRVKTSGVPRSSPIQLRRKGRLDALRQLTEDVAEFEVELSHPMIFRPGQFVTMAHESLEGSRAYSMVNHTKEADRLTFVVKRKPGGGFSRFIFNRDPRGVDLDIVGPLGRATFRPEENKDFLCIAGGSGIAGMMAMLRQATEARYFTPERKGRVFFGVRTVRDAFYLEQFVEHVGKGDGALKVIIAVSDESDVPPSHPDYSGIAFASGMVHEVAAPFLKHDWSNAIAFVAGPPPMVDASLGVLIKSGIGPQNIRFDKFS